MSLVHKQMAWGCIVGVALLVCISGCSLKEEPVPLPPAPQAKEEAAPAGKPNTTQVGPPSFLKPPCPRPFPLPALLYPVQQRRSRHQESRAAPLSTLLRGAPAGLPLRAGRAGRAVGEAWLPAGGIGGLQGVRSEAPAQQCFWTSYPSGIGGLRASPDYS